MTKRTITLEEVKSWKNDGTNTVTLKDNSARGCKTICIDSVKVGDKILVDNYFAEVIETDDMKKFEKRAEEIASIGDDKIIYTDWNEDHTILTLLTLTKQGFVWKYNFHIDAKQYSMYLLTDQNNDPNFSDMYM